MKYKVSNIKWDLEGENIDIPTEMVVEVDPNLDNYEKMEYISDKITEQTGFCHKGFTTNPPIEE